MANPLKCDLCSKPATVHLTQIVNSKVHKVDLCEACAQSKGVTDPQGFSLADLLLKTASEGEQTPAGAHCPRCGYSHSDFKKQGRFGCPDCYSTFSTLLEPMLENMHKGSNHTGKVPRKVLERKTVTERLGELESRLGLAIKEEKYEEAAQLRDEISEIRQTGIPKSV